MRTLLVGAGIAGLTLGGLLCRQERPPVIVERSVSAGDGYAIGLYPLGSCVLHGLGAYPKLAARSLVLARYELAAGSGRVLQSLDMSVLTGAVGPLLMLSRRDLVEVLEACCGPADLRRGVTISSLTQHEDAVEAEFSDGTAGRGFTGAPRLPVPGLRVAGSPAEGEEYVSVAVPGQLSGIAYGAL